MAGRVLVAGATGAIGWLLCQLLVAEGFEVTGTTRSAAKAERLREAAIAAQARSRCRKALRWNDFR